MSSPLYSLQAVKEGLGLSDTHIPSDSEVADIRKKQFTTYPGAGKTSATPIPEAVEKVGTGSFPAKPIEDVKTIHEMVLKKGSVFFSSPSQGISAANAKKTVLSAVTFDLILSESHELSASVCTHPVQNGEPVTDHVQPLPTKVKFKILVTEYSLKDAPGGWRGGTFSTATSRSKNTLAAFKEILANRMVCSIVLVLDVYEDMLITSVTAARDGTTGESQEFDVEAVQIKRTNLVRAPIGATAKPADMASPEKRRMSGDSSEGSQTPPDTEYSPEMDTVPGGVG